MTNSMKSTIIAAVAMLTLCGTAYADQREADLNLAFSVCAGQSSSLQRSHMIDPSSYPEDYRDCAKIAVAFFAQQDASEAGTRTRADAMAHAAIAKALSEISTAQK